MQIIQWILISIGNLGLWFSIYNQVHSTSWPRPIRKMSEKVLGVLVLLSFGWFLLSVLKARSISVADFQAFSWFHTIYLYLCLLLGVVFSIRWCLRNLIDKPRCLKQRSQSIVDLQKRIGENVYTNSRARLLASIPLNRAHVLSTDKRTLAIKGLPPELEGLKICHLTDWHLMDQISRRWFEEVVIESNLQQPDLVLITGDLLDEKECLEWIDPVFGQLKSKYGSFFIRGNHDRRVGDQEVLLNRMQQAGMQWVGDGNWHRIDINGATIDLAGNELPWFEEADELPAKERQAASDSRALRVLLTHSPDQYKWALERDFDLILAGHNHGGQIRLPVIGPLVAPSKYGVRFAGGTYQLGSTAMHVSRGLSGDKCLRIHCPPELAVITLTCDKTKPKR